MKSLFTDMVSTWQEVATPTFFAVNENMSTDVLVIGAGIAGLSTAYQLLKNGKSVIVIDRELHLGLHESGLTSAHLSNAVDGRYSFLRQVHGLETMRLVAESHTQAITMIEHICQEEGIDCDFKRVNGYLFLDSEDDLKLFKDEVLAAREVGLNVELLSRAPLQMFDTGPCILFPNQGQFHPVKYLQGLAQAIQRLGGKIFTESPATDVKYGAPHKVITDQNYEILCQDLVVCTNSPVNDIITMHTKMGAYRSYVIAVEIPRGQLEPMLLWDTGDPYHYVRLIQNKNSEYDLLIVGGEDHRTGQQVFPEACYENLKHWVRERLQIQPRVVAQWSGQILETFDGLAFIGKNPSLEKNIYIITGDCGMGLTYGTMGSAIIRDLILGRSNAWSEVYNPRRLAVRNLNEYVRENFHSISPYSDWLLPGNIKSTEEIAPGEGAILRRGLKKLACYKDTFGNMHVFSAKCPHLGGLVRWNSSEKTWDCPCHGSRFHRYGEVINGPAPHGLQPLAEHGEDSHLAPSP